MKLRPWKTAAGLTDDVGGLVLPGLIAWLMWLA